MRRSAVLLGLPLALCGWLALAPSAARADEPRSAAAVLKDIDAVQMPDLEKVNRENRTEVLKYIKDRQAAMTRKAELIGELYKVDPENAGLSKLFPERWQALLMGGQEKVDDVKKEVKQVLAKAKSPALKADAAFFNALLILKTGNPDPKTALAAAEDFVKVAPDDERGAMLLYSVASELNDTAQQAAIYKRLVKDYPKSQVASMVGGTLKQLDSVGKPFDLEFKDAVHGETVSIKGLKGKVVVVDFWATWCGPCVAEMPNMKRIYSEYHGKGVEFIGVSLDASKEEGGLDKLKEFVAQNEIPWPQYYQGKGWESEFSRSWGVNAIPALFVVDTEGKLYSVNARGKLETMIPELLKKGKGDAGAGAGGGN